MTDQLMATSVLPDLPTTKDHLDLMRFRGARCLP